MPVANLNTYHVAALRVRATQPQLQRLAAGLAQLAADKLHTQCGFDNVVFGNAPGADVLLDLTITGAGRGGTNPVFKNNNLVTVETLLVISDGQSNDLLGTARIHGESSGVLVAGRPPEAEAIDVVSKAAVELLAKSGCSGPRVAKVEPPPQPQPQPGSDATPQPNGSDDRVERPNIEGHRADAEALNDQGKEKLRGADLDGALASFQQANQMVPDARYEYNVCLAFEAQQQWDSATSACTQARGMTGVRAELVVKIDARLTLLKNHQ
jgi:hypothetical protein